MSQLSRGSAICSAGYLDHHAQLQPAVKGKHLYLRFCIRPSMAPGICQHLYVMPCTDVLLEY